MDKDKSIHLNNVFFVDSILWVTISSSPKFSSHSSQILLQVATFCSPCMRPCMTSWVALEIYRYYDCCVNLLAVIFYLMCWLEHRSLLISIRLSFLLVFVENSHFSSSFYFFKQEKWLFSTCAALLPLKSLRSIMRSICKIDVFSWRAELLGRISLRLSKTSFLV